MSDKTINGIDVSESVLIATNKNIYYLLDKIKRLQEENEKLKDRNANLRLNLATYDLPEVKKVLTDWRTGELQLQENKLKKYKQTLEEIRKLINETCWDYTDISIIPVKEKMLEVINEVLNDRD